ncbi:hypothetical protein J6O48_08485 [bacterium]|nr:hypothetical protein [bacterium]
MLNEKAIDNLVQPIVTRQENINTYVLTKIARSVREIGEISPSDVNRMKILVGLGTDIREMNAELARLSNVQVKDIKSLIKTVAIETNLDAKPLYDYRHKSFIPYEKNTKLKNIVNIVGNRTAGTYENISNSKATGFLIRDLKHPGILKFQSIDDTYKSVVDEAIQASASGVVDYRTAMRRTLKQLSDSGIRRLSWDSGYTQRLDTAVRRNILDGIRAIQQGIEDAIGEEIGADGKELSVHINCALDHEPFQGHQFTNENWEKLQNSEDFQDIQGKNFKGVERVIGMWNCRHVARSIIVGVTKPLYTPEKLQKFIEDNHEGYVLPNGKRITMYECTQMQRQMETRIRYAKDEQIVFQQSGNIEAAKIAQQKVKKYQQQYYKFSKDCGLPIHKDRAAVQGYKFV